MLSLLDTLGLTERDLSPAVTDVVNRWVSRSQRIWRDLLINRRKEIQALLDGEPKRVFQSVTGKDATVWTALRESDTLKELLDDIQSRNPTIYEAPTLTTASLLKEAQGDALPLVWSTIAKIDAREYEIDTVAASSALAASRSYALKRRAIRDFGLLSLKAEPEINTCPHVARLEALRNVRDFLQKSRLLREFIEEYQGGRSGDWMTCTVCQKPCVCYHEIMELEALAQPARMDAIQKQILIRFGGERYEGKVVCKNCGQALQDIDYDEHVEFDDEGRPVTGSSVLTDEQIEEAAASTGMKTAESLLPKELTFPTEDQTALYDALQFLLQRGGMQVDVSVIRQIVRYADLYVSARSPPQKAYEEKRAKMLTSAATRIRTTTGAGVSTAVVDIPTYAAVRDQLRVSALGALVALHLQIAVPTIIVSNPSPYCKFVREGWPLNPEKEPNGPGVLSYVACIIAYIDRDVLPWRNLTWAGELKAETRVKKALATIISAAQVILAVDEKAAPLSFTPEIRAALTKARTDEGAARERTMVSLKDQIPSGFRPEAFPPKLNRPAVERDPLPAIEAALAAGSSIEEFVPAVAAATRQQGIAVVSELHAAAESAVEAMPAKPSGMTDTVCCPVSMAEAEAGALFGAPEQPRLLVARELLRGGIPTATNAGTHLWAMIETPVPEPVEQSVDPAVFFKLFLKYCYSGPQVGDAHEFGVGNICRQCGFALGKPFELVNFATEGAGILAAQQGTLRIEVTQPAFDGLSDAVRRRKIIQERSIIGRQPWQEGLQSIINTARRYPNIAEDEGQKVFAGTLEAVLTAIAGHEEESLDEVGRGTLWEPLASYMDGLRAEVAERIGPVIPRGTGKMAEARAREAKTALAMFDALTEDPFIEGPRALQEYWCAKTEAAGASYGVTKVNGARWFNISEKHNERLDKLLKENAEWFAGELRDGTRDILRRVGITIGPLLRVWIQSVRAATRADGLWTIEEARIVLRTIVLQSWRDAVNASSWMYRTVGSPAEREATAANAADWTRALMYHVKQQFVRYSKEEIKRVLQQRAELDRTSIVEEFAEMKDDDLRAAMRIQMNLKIGRWARGQNIRTLDADTYEFESEQRRRQGIIDAPVDPILLEGALPVAAGPAVDFGLANEALSGYEVNQLADGDDY
jgi:hypothetical protein